MISKESRELILKALEIYRGDDYYRAKQAFAGYSAEEMKKPYGPNGQTRQDILNSYRSHSEKVSKAVRELLETP